MALNHNTSHLQSMLAPCHTKPLIKRAESNVGSIVGFQQYAWPIEAQLLDRTQNYPGNMSTSSISSANVVLGRKERAGRSRKHWRAQVRQSKVAKLPR